MIRSLLLAASASLALTHAAHAQRPVITQDADEPGRAPYQTNVQTTCTAGGFSDNDFAAVPGGKRLVVTFVSGFFVAAGSDGSELSYLGHRGDGKPKVFVPLFKAVGLQRLVSAAVQYYVDPGVAPAISIDDCYPDTGVELTVVGYLVTIP